LFSVQFMSAREFCPGESLSSEQCSSTFEFEQSSRLLTSSSRNDLSSKGRPTELRAVRCVTLFGGRREVTRHDVASDPNNWGSTSREGQESDAEIHVAWSYRPKCRLCRASPLTEAPRRGRSVRLLPCFYVAVQDAPCRCTPPLTLKC